jgi:hypothetical protein
MGKMVTQKVTLLKKRTTREITGIGRLVCMSELLER